MLHNPSNFLAALLVLVAPLFVSFINLPGQTPDALAGTVSSDAEGPMEGVLVKAKRVGGPITVTVVSDEHGRYVFPVNVLKPGRYAIAVRAVGFDLPEPGLVTTIANKSTNLDLKLKKVGINALAEQLQPAEWLMSIPGTVSQKAALFTCAGACHNLNLVLQSHYNAAEWMPVLVRMRNWGASSKNTKPIHCDDCVNTGPRPGDEEFAEYLASINLSSKPRWNFELKTFPRPKGKATQVIYTEYDIPRENAEPHDVVLDASGMIWYIDHAEPVLGRLNPRTGETREWKLPDMRSGFNSGSLGLAIDKAGDLWIARSHQGGVAEFDPKTEKIRSYPMPKEYENSVTSTSFVAVGSDGKVWFDDPRNRRMYILEPGTGQISSYPLYPGFTWDRKHDPGPTQGNGENHFPYGIAIGSDGMGYWSDFGNRNIGKMDPVTGKTSLYPTPTLRSAPRRMTIGPDGELWFAENNLNARKIAVFDTKSKGFREWADPLPWDTPYDAVRDKAGYVWTGGMTSDFVTRLSPETSEMVQYLLPTLNVNIREVVADNLTIPPSLLLGENHQGRIVLVHPLD